MAESIDSLERMLAEVDGGAANASVVIRAHGIGPEEYERIAATGAEVIDATCPFVRKIHRLVRECREAGKHVVIIGNPEHPEVAGIRNWCRGSFFVSDDPDEVFAHISDFLNEHPGQTVSVVEQTTFSEIKFKKFAENAKKTFDNVEIFGTICSATSRRQLETAQIASEADMMVVVGDRTSSNTEKLYNICRDVCGRAVWVESAAELPTEELRHISFVGVTAGASTPDWIIREVINNMSEIDKIEAAVENIAETGEAAVSEATAVAEETVSAVENAQAAAEEVTEAVKAEVEEVAEAAAEVKAEAEEAVAAVAEEVQTEAAEAVEAVEAEAEKVAETVEEADQENFASLLEDSLSAVRNGDVVTGTINKIDDKGVYVDFGFKYEGFIAIDEFAAVPGHDVPELKIGDEVKAQVVKVNDKDCEVILSKRRLDN